MISFLLCACSSSKSFVYFEALQPADVSYPSDIRKVGYLNRSPLSIHSLTPSNRKNLDATGLSIIDTIVCNNLKEGFLEGRKSKEISYLDSIVFLEERRYDTIGRENPLDGYELWRIFNENKLDALISMEYYSLELNKSFTYYNYELLDYVEEFSFFMEIVWRVYTPNSSMPIDTFRTSDTLYFLNQSSREGEYLSATDVLEKGSGILGYEYGRRHVPYWTEVARVVFRGGSKELREAASYTDEGKWEKAAELWKQTLEYPDDESVAKAYHNLSVYYEIEDDIPMAYEMAVAAATRWDNTFIQNHKKAMETRLKSRERLFRQLDISVN